MGNEKLPARTIAFKCERRACGATRRVKLAAGVSTPTRVDCNGCGTRDAAVPAKQPKE